MVTSVSLASWKKIDDAPHIPFVAAEFKNINLGELLKILRKALRTPIEVSGQAHGRIELSMEDPDFKEQPSGELEITVKKLRPPNSVPTNIGPVNLPEMKFSKLYVKARLVGGQIIVDEGTLGQKDEPISGKFKGKMSLRFSRFGSKVNASPKEYEFKIDLHVRKSAQPKLALFLGFIDKFKTTTNSGSRYMLKISASKLGVPPVLDPIRKL